LIFYFCDVSVILHIETATKNCSVALSKSGEVLGFKEHYSEQFSHSEQLHGFIQDILKEAQMEMSALDAVAVSKGPGSYTGLRIGVATAKGICFALDLPLIAVNSLQILSEKYQDNNQALLFPMFDARRMEVYVMVLNEKKEVVKPTFAEIVGDKSFKEFPINLPWIFMGEGAQKCKEVFYAPHIEYRIDMMYPSAIEMIPSAWRAFQSKNFEDVAYFEPFYLKDFYTTAKKIGD
jgi:tRNA threonylcarbamoyladenosine biosynthesis protein TsaB